MGKLIVFILLFIFIASNNINAQIKISGKITDTLNQPVSGATITLLQKEKSNIIQYTFSNNLGNYEISTPIINNNTQYLVRVSVLGFFDETKEVNIVNNKVITLNFSLKYYTQKLQEVIIKSKDPIVIKKDTINYNVDKFTSTFDKTIGDVLKRLPGIEVMPNGVILYEGKPINKFYIEGKDLLDGRYNLATNNIPANAVDKIQVLEKHQPIKLLDSFISSNRAALNLVLKDKAKNKLIGKIKLGIGVPLISTDNEIVPLLFSPQHQSIATLKYNNIGKDYAAELQKLIFEDLNDELITNLNYGNLLQINKPQISDLNLDRYQNNKQFSGSLNQLKTTKNNNELKYYVDFVSDVSNMVAQNSLRQFFVNDTFKIEEINFYNQKQNQINATIDFTINKSTIFFNTKTIFKNTTNKSNSTIINPRTIFQNKTFSAEDYSNILNYTIKKNKHLFILRNVIGYNKQPQKLLINNMQYDTVITKTVDPYSILQTVNLSTYYVNSSINWSYKLKSNIVFNNATIINYNVSKIFTNIIAANENGLTHEVKDGFINDNTFKTFHFQNNFSLEYKFKNLSIRAGIPLLINKINNTSNLLKNQLNTFL